MRARRLRRDPCRVRQLARRQCTPVEQRREHDGARGIRQQECRAGKARKLEMSLFDHGVTVPPARSGGFDSRRNVAGLAGYTLSPRWEFRIWIICILPADIPRSLVFYK